MSCLDERLLCLCLPATREQLAAAQGKVARLCEGNAVLTEKVTEAERDRDAAVADSSAAVVRAGQYQDLHTTLLEACGGVVDVLSLAGVSVEERLGNVLRRFMEVIRHAVHRRATLALAAAFLRSSEDLRYMEIRFPPMEKPDNVGALAVEFRSAAGAIVEYERVEDVICSAPHEV
jgi:hypothetical protein